MGVFTRFISFLNFNDHRNMYHQGARDLFFKNSLRDIEEQIRNREKEFKKNVDLRKLEMNEYNKYAEACEKIEQELSMSDDKHQEQLQADQLNTLLVHKDEIAQRVENYDRQIIQILDSVENLRLKYEHMTDEAKKYFLNPDDRQSDQITPDITHQNIQEV